MQKASSDIRELKILYRDIRHAIEERLRIFDRFWKRSSEVELFRELAFCLLTPQSRALSCWEAVKQLDAKDLLFRGYAEEISAALNIVRFRNNKARYIIEARHRFCHEGRPGLRETLQDLGTPADMRSWLSTNIKGYGLKEASHFLRNIGLGGDIAILDRHILRCLIRTGIIDTIPASLTPRRYHEIEEGMRHLSREMGIPLSHLDFLFWYRQTGFLFK